MKQTVTFVISAIVAGNVCARALTLVSTGNLASGGTWSGGSRPKSGDSVTIALPQSLTDALWHPCCRLGAGFRISAVAATSPFNACSFDDMDDMRSRKG